MKNRKASTTLLLVLFVLISCSSSIDNSNQIGKFSITVENQNKTGNRVVIIKGENIDSALWIKEYIISYKKEKVFIRITKSIKNTGISGPYSLQFIISDSVNEIVLGNRTIWKQ